MPVAKKFASSPSITTGTSLHHKRRGTITTQQAMTIATRSRDIGPKLSSN
jgi:hypothetical protein